jgi:integrase
MPNARKLPSGSWRVQVFSHYVYTKGGKKKRIYESFTASTKREAERAATAWAAAGDRRTREDYTLEEAMDEYVKAKSNILSPSTVRGYHTLMRCAYDHIKDKKIRSITQADVQSWMNRYAVTHAPKGCQNAHGFLTAVLRMFRPDLHIYTKLPQKERTERYTPSDADIQRLLSSIDNDDMINAILLALFSLRRGEICALTDEDIDMKTGAVSVTKSLARADGGGYVVKLPKTPSSTRTIYVPKEILDRFTGIKGRLIKIDMDDLSQKFAKAVRDAGLPHFRFHDLRSYFATVSADLHIPDTYVLKSGGWKTDRVMKEVYRRTITDREKGYSDIYSDHIKEIMQHEMQHDTKKSL